MYANDRGYYGARKLKYWPLLCLQFNGCYLDTIVAGREWTSVQMGIDEALLVPQGSCSCGVSDVWDNMETQYYLKTGTGNIFLFQCLIVNYEKNCSKPIKNIFNIFASIS